MGKIAAKRTQYGLSHEIFRELDSLRLRHIIMTFMLAGQWGIAAGNSRKLNSPRGSEDMVPSRHIPNSVSIRHFHCRLLAMVLFTVALLVQSASAKDAPLSAVELYDGPNGPAYVLITAVTINNKNELRGCGSGDAITKRAYGDSPKIVLAADMTLEYTQSDGLVLTRDGGSSCVAPSNVKFEKNAPMTPTEIAGKAVLTARVMPSESGEVAALPPLKPGVKIVFAASPDAELGEFLRAGRASTIASWQDYLKKDPSSAHSADAKQSLATLLVKDGQSGLAAYKQSARGTGPFPTLQKAQADADQALAAVPGQSDASALGGEIQAELASLTQRGKSELDLYKTALTAHTTGYAHLTAALALGSSIVSVNPRYSEGTAFQNLVTAQALALESSLKSAESFVAEKQFDDAMTAIAAYISFSSEVPRVAAVIDADYAYHFNRGMDLGNSRDWQGSVQELQKAAAVKQTNEVAVALKNAQHAWQVAQDKSAAQAAMQQSQSFGQQQQYIQAYEVLDSLPAGPHALVTDEMQRLAPVYIQAASNAANQIQQAHDPIRGLADEVEIVRAYGYLKKAYALNNDPSLNDRINNLADKLSDYYLAQAQTYMAKPLGSGAGVAWSYLQKALPYKASNLDAVRDAMTQEAAAYQMRSRLSIRVEFRDQTSRRDSAGFADQLADAIATGLETSGLPVRVIRPGDKPLIEPNFQLIGDVLEHYRAEVPTEVPKESTYRAGEQEVPNEAWNQANRDYEGATLNLQTDQAALQGLMGKGKKKDIEDATGKVTTDQKQVSDAHAKLDSIPKTLPKDIIKPYTYTEKDVDLSAGVQLQYRINDSLGNPVEPDHPVSKKNSEKYSILENVKPEDTGGVRTSGTIPDDMQFLTNVENAVRDDLTQAVRQSVASLPAKVYARAQKQVQEGDMDGAAESYILFLNATPVADTPERQAAQKFLVDQFNIQAVVPAATSSY